MFYAHFVLSKKGPLARIWLAAHWDKKLTKAHVFETNIDSSVEAIIEPKVKMALRTSGHLLLGVVRIYSRKAKYLLADCNEAFVKIKMAFRPGVVDMPEENREAAVATITLPENFHDFDTTMADLSDIDVQAQFSVNQSRPEEITMREDLGNITLVGDDGFGDMGFDDRNIIQDANMDDTLYKTSDATNLLLDDSLEKNQDDVEKPLDIDFDAATADGNFGKNDFDDYEGPAGVDDDDESDNDGGFGGGVDDDLFNDNFMGVGESTDLFEEPPTAPEPIQPAIIPEPEKPVDQPEVVPPPRLEETEIPVPDQTTIRDQTTLVHNEAEAFALEPLDVTSLGTERKTKRKRKLIVDEQKGIASETMKMQLADTSEIMTTLDLAPPTKKLMHWKETGGVEKLFALPGRPITSKKIAKAFSHNLITKPVKDMEDDDDKLELETPQEEDHAEVRREEVPVFEPPHLEPPPMMEDTPVRQSLDQSAFSAAADTSTFSRREESLLPQEVSLPQHEVSLPQPDVSLQLPAPEVSLPLPPPAAGSDSEMDDDDNEPLPSPESLPPPEEPEPAAEDDMFMNALPTEETEQAPEEDGQSDIDEEEKEERRWGKRSQQLLYIITKNFNAEKEQASFKAMCQRNYRKQVASKFYTLLVLKKQQAIYVDQPEPFADITITKGPKFELLE